MITVRIWTIFKMRMHEAEYRWLWYCRVEPRLTCKVA